MDIGTKIKSFAKSRYSSLTGLASALDIDLPSLHRYTTGKVKPGLDFFAKMLSLGCDLNWLLAEEDLPEGNAMNEPTILYNPHKIETLEAEIAALRSKFEQLKKANKQINTILEE